MGTFDPAVIRNPEIFQENREPARSDHRWTLGDGTDPVFSLNGEWLFRYAENPAGTAPDFSAPALDCRGWDTIRVPGHIQLQGWGHPQYLNVQYPWDGGEDVALGAVPERYNPVGSYVKYFTLPDFMAGKRVYISFQGAESALAVWLNGRYVGYGEDAFTPSEFELTPYLVPGENKLAVRVFRFTAASWYEDQDFFRFSGLFRDVYLYAVPRAHIRDLKVTTSLSEDFSRGEVRLDMETAGAGTVRCRLSGGGAEAAACEVPLGAPAALPVERPMLWSAERPHLYRLELTVLDDTGAVSETVTQDVGLRRFEIRDGLMLLNGRRILFRGVNRHEFSAQNGRCVTEEETLRDILTMKRHNINAIRTSHYPNQSFLYRLCDQYGVYVLDEMNLESHGTWDMYYRGRIPLEELIPGDDPKWRGAVLARAEAMYRRDKNHPSVLIWSCGNESMGGKNLSAAWEYFHSVDDRPVHYEGEVHDRRYPISDILSNMYWPAEAIRAALEKDSSRPAISCEYGHAMGNSFGNQLRYALLAEEAPAYQGGFIWDYIDQALLAKDRYGRDYLGYGGDFGDRPNDGNFSGDGIVYAGTRLPSPKMQEVKACYQNLRVRISDGQAEIANHYLFTNSAEFACVEQLFREGILLAEAPVDTAVPPGERRSYSLPLWPERLDGEYSVIVSFRLRADTGWAKAGHEVAFGEWSGGAILEPPHPAEPPEVIDGAWNLGVRGRDFRVLFSKDAHTMTSYRWKGRELLHTGPMPNFWRAPTDNDRGCRDPFRYAQWKAASLYAVPGSEAEGESSCRVERGENWVEVTFSYLLPTAPRTACQASYRVYADGLVEAALRSDGAEKLGPMPEFGLILKMDADFGRVRWYGRGPEETYCDRKAGGRLGIYETRAADSLAGYLRPQECGNRTDTRWASVTDEAGVGLEFRGKGMEFSALPWTPHELENAAHPHELPPIHRTVVRVALKQMGVAGDDSWGARPAPEHLLRPSALAFHVSFRGVG